MNQELFTLLFKKYISGTCTRAEREQFFDQIRHNRGNGMMNSLMDALYREIKKDDEKRFFLESKPLDRSDRLKSTSLVHYAAIAAVWIFAVLFLFLYTFNSKPVVEQDEKYQLKFSENTYATLKTQQKYLLLADSTQIWMNGSTHIGYPAKFSADKREIYLEGEAFLDVKHAEDIPFIIHMPGNISITVLGTAFNIKTSAEAGKTIIAVKRGKVRVAKNDKIISTLSVGQEIQVLARDNLAFLKNVDVEGIDAWQKNNLYFNDIPMKDLIKFICEFKKVKITIEDEKLGGTIISLGFKKNETIDGILKVIKATTDCNVTEEKGTYKLY